MNFRKHEIFAVCMMVLGILIIIGTLILSAII